MQWNVLLHDVNAGTITTWNIFKHGGFTKDVEKLLAADLDREYFSELLQQRIRYYFGTRSEYEIVVTSWPPYMNGADIVKLNKEYEDHKATRGKYPYKLDVALDVGKKMDIYDQVMLNWDVFVDYVLSNKEETR